MMSFEIREKDLLGRIGKLETKSGTVETPLLFPVVNPVLQVVSPSRIREEFGFEALITNAYILKRRFQNEPVERGIHQFLDYDGAVMTDSGAYQILVYGNVEVSPGEIVEYQERIGSDIATILDIPTGWKVTREHAEQTVNETLKRAREFFTLRRRDDILWVGPVQGGRYLDLLSKSATEMAKMSFEIYALGSPTEVMEHYRFDVLVDMIATVKMHLPIERPLHLFGAGHPFMFSMAVALGCDFFDSAAYSLYAQNDRYMTENGTFRLGELRYFPCSCPKCTKSTPKSVNEFAPKERQAFLAEHNLYVCGAELRRIKQAIKEGRLWEHVEMRAHAHPALFQAVKKLGKYQELIEKHDPATKESGLFFFNSIGLMRPEVLRYKNRLAKGYSKPRDAKMLLLIPQGPTKPFHNSKSFKEISRLLQHATGGHRIHQCFYAAPFGVMPVELDEVYPLSQYEIACPLDYETVEYVSNQIADYVIRTNYQMVILLNDTENWGRAVFRKTRRACSKRNIKFKCVEFNEKLSMPLSAILRRTLQTAVASK